MAGKRGSRAKGIRQDPSPAHDVANDIGVADEDLIAVLLLLGVRPVDIVPEGGLDPRSIFIILLGAEEGIVRMEAVWAPLLPGAQGQRGGCSPQEAAPGGVFFYHSLWLPVRHGGVGLDGGAFPQQVCADLADSCREAQDSAPLGAATPPSLLLGT